MWDAFNYWAGTAVSTLVSLFSVTLGTLIRYFHKAKRTKEPIDWARFRYEWPTIFGLALLAGPLSEYVSVKFDIHQGTTAGVCICLGYLGTKILDVVGAYLEKPSDENP